MAQFDPEDKSSWFFGDISRVDTNSLLLDECDSGGFLVRDSTSCVGQYVLSVNEELQIRHYIINPVESADGQSILRIGEMKFPTLTALIDHYMQHPLDKTSLVKPAEREKFRADYDFEGKDEEDLSFKRGDILQLLEKREESWWLVKHANGGQGLVPVNYLSKMEHHDQAPPAEQPTFSNESADTNNVARLPSLPAMAVVIKNRIPCAYRAQDLKLQIGQHIKVLSMDISGTWSGELIDDNNRFGYFPFTHVQLLENQTAAPESSESTTPT